MKIAVLGPKGTYSDIACDKYLEANQLNYEKVYYPSILKTALAVDENTIAILPFENTLDGFVMESLDRIITQNIHIVEQVKLNIDFAFVSNAEKLEDVKTVYVQFKAYGQCLDFIAEQSFDVIKTDSNSQTAELVKTKDATYGAIIPMHLVDESAYKLILPHVADSKNNETRFFIVQAKDEKKEFPEYMTSVVVKGTQDRPGLLYAILKEFHWLDINLNSILSRPSKENLGQYYFYMECSLSERELRKLSHLVEELAEEGFTLEILGVYNSFQGGKA